ncbi:hypothetical protein A2U01_0085299, partial [Trifolium medium]|nr:hypothetical protein [Trifolium medium]
MAKGVLAAWQTAQRTSSRDAVTGIIPHQIVETVTRKTPPA